jgi:hypothetical protein
VRKLAQLPLPFYYKNPFHNRFCQEEYFCQEKFRRQKSNRRRWHIFVRENLEDKNRIDDAGILFVREKFRRQKLTQQRQLKICQGISSRQTSGKRKGLSLKTGDFF